MSESMKKIITSYERDIKKRKALYKKYDLDGANELEPDYNLFYLLIKIDKHFVKSTRDNG